MEKQLSIIIPVYNVEKYLEQCLQSIVGKITDSVEVIIVNDGSPDNSGEIISKYKINHPMSIIVLNQENQGLSMARNNGLNIATGKYVWFVDSDDWLKDDAFDIIKRELENNADIDVFSSYLAYYYEKDGSLKEKKYVGPSTMSGIEYLKRKLPQGASPRFIYKREFLVNNRLQFVPGLLHEDAIWGYMMLYKAEKVRFLESPVYIYRIRMSDSIMSSITLRSAYDLIKGHKILTEWMADNVISEDKKLFEFMIFGLIKSLLDFCKDLRQTTEYKNFMSKYKGYIKRKALHSFFINKNDVSLLIIAISPKFFSLLCKIKEAI